MVSNPQCVGFVYRLKDLFGLLMTPGCVTSDMQQIAMLILLCQFMRLDGQLLN
jgi:hypothetical protein